MQKSEFNWKFLFLQANADKIETYQAVDYIANSTRTKLLVI